MKYEFIKYIKSKKFLIVFILLMILSVLQSADTFRYTRIQTTHPAFLSILSNNNDVKFAIVLVWLMPIYLILSYCDKYNIERKHGMQNLYFTKMSRKTHFWIKMRMAFLNPFILIGIPVLFNLLTNISFLHGETGFFNFEMYSHEELEVYEYFPMDHPYLEYLIHFAALLIVCGLLGCVCQCVCMVTKDNKISYVICLLYWMLYFSDRHISLDPSTLAFSFEAPLFLFVLSLVIFCVPAILIILISYKIIMGRKDEI